MDISHCRCYYLDTVSYIFYDSNLTNTHYLASRIAIGGALLGGAMFGVGMAFVGTCSFGTLLRLASGDMRAVISALIIGISGYAAIRGTMAIPRLYVDNYTDIHLNDNVTSSILNVSNTMTVQVFLVVLIATSMFIFCFKSRNFLTSYKLILGGIITGALIASFWFVTGILAFDEFNLKTPQSYTFVAPLGDIISYIMLSTGVHVKISVFSILGVLVGGFLATCRLGELRLDAFDDAIEMRRHIFGSALMGFGGALAGGCTFGQGLTGLSTLSITSFIAFTSMIIGAILGLKYLMGYYYKC